MQNATTRRRLTELLPITITWGEIFFDALASRSLQDPLCPSITNISTSSYMWSAVIYCNKKVLMSPSIFLTISQTSNICQKNAGSVWPSVQLTVEPGRERWNWLVVVLPESWLVWASTGAQAAQGHRRKAGIGQTTWRRSGHTDNLPRFYLLHILVLEWLSLDITLLGLIFLLLSWIATNGKEEFWPSIKHNALGIPEKVLRVINHQSRSKKKS